MLCALLAPMMAQADPRSAATARALGDAFADVAERVGPATVYIQADKARPLSLGLQQLQLDYALPTLERPQMGWSTSSGSGVIIRDGGLVLTNHHVISGAHNIQVTLWDKRTYAASLVGTDPRTDVAVLQIVGEGPFPTAAIGDSDGVRIGNWVLAIGHPFDFQFTVTAGIVSARGRRNLVREEIQDYIQTDAAVNPGSSGGPLFNLDGEVIGINTAIYTPEGGSVQNAGISFAIPSNMAWRITQELLDHGRVARASIGVATRDAPPTPDHPRPGAEITHVIAESPAENAGLRRGDVILSVDEEAIGGSDDLRGIVLARGPRVKMNVIFERGGVEQRVILTTSSDGQPVVDNPTFEVPIGAVEWGGMLLAEANETRLSEYGVVLPEDKGPGLIVLSVAPESPAAAAGLAAGDVVLRIHRDPVPDGPRLLEVVAGRRSALVWFWRNDDESLAAIGGLNQ